MDLLNEVLSAHGGMDRWNKFNNVSAMIRSAGQLWDMKHVPQDPSPREMSVALKREWSSVSPYGAPDHRTDFTAHRIAIVDATGKVVSERLDPAAHADGQGTDAPWDALDRAFFNGYALWTYLTVPFLFTWPQFELEEISSWKEKDEVWRGLRVRFPEEIVSHSQEQDFYFGEDNLLRRHDYMVNAAGGFAAAQYVSNYIDERGIKFPAVRRAFMRNEDLTPKPDRLMVSIDLSDFKLS